ncbi:hypothetical protein [Candidatus Protochlamydia phocaeensis]|uniref:hypothetical protein n=1 Tax=Candidatus Protochlamydia phocaeensis TaxID=1414722 RepID=UPI000839963D|nr:hypothetical protein [Candidatus Protochlamydia phocaeensis]
MENDVNLFNATVIAENPDSSFIILEGDRLHAVEPSVANFRKEHIDQEHVVSLMCDGLKALIEFAQGKAEAHFLEVDWDALASRDDEQAILINKIHHIFSHLPHHFRNDLSSLIHHKQAIS